MTDTMKGDEVPSASKTAVSTDEKPAVLIIGGLGISSSAKPANTQAKCLRQATSAAS